MVQRGQFLERPTLIPAGQHTLEGLWHRGDKEPAALLVPPLPGQGSMDLAALNESAFALSRAGHPSLRFNFGGVGASQGNARTAKSLANDARAALRHLVESAGFESVAAVSIHSGCQVALQLLSHVSHLVFISPPADLKLDALARSEVRALFAIAETDPLRARWGEHCAHTGDRLAVIEGADPAYNRGLVQLARAVVEFVEPA